MKKLINIFVFAFIILVFESFGVMAEESKVQPPIITNEKLREYKEFISKFGIKEKEIPDLKSEIVAHQKDINYEENVQRALKEKTESEKGYKVRANCGRKNDIKILLNYSVIYDAKPNREYIYNVSGSLYQIAYIYEKYKAVYSNTGRLVQIIFPIDKNFSCTFSGKGAFQGVVDTEGNLYNRSGSRPNLEDVDSFD